MSEVDKLREELEILRLKKELNQEKAELQRQEAENKLKPAWQKLLEDLGNGLGQASKNFSNNLEKLGGASDEKKEKK